MSSIIGFNNIGVESVGGAKKVKSPEEIRLDKINEAQFKLTELQAKLNDLGEEENEIKRIDFRKQIQVLLEEIKNLI